MRVQHYAEESGEALSISLLGELRVFRAGEELPLPASRKARALLAFLIATGRPHRRERLCELFWDLPDDPRAALRWSLTKLRKVIDDPDRPRIVADRERVAVDTEGLRLDIRAMREDVASGLDALPLDALEAMARRLDEVLLDGLDGAGGEAFADWLSAERADAEGLRIEVLRHLASHPANPPAIAEKWRRLWHAANPSAARETPDPAPQRETVPQSGQPPRIASGLRAQKIGFCDVADGTTIAYATVGSGLPFLKAANWLTHLEFDWTSPIWGECFADIAHERSFIRYDERGCGLSDWDADDLSFDAFVEDLEAVADRLELERFPLLGISQGAAVSIEYAARHPERVSGLILFGGYAAGWRHTTTDDEKARREAVRDLTRVGWGTDNPAYRHIFSQTFMPGVSPDELAWFDEFQRLTTSPENAARFQDAFGDIDVRHRLGDVKAPTLVLHSTGDQRIPVSDGRYIARAIPGAQFVPLDSRNHVLVGYEPAWQTCMEAIREFLKEHDI